MQMPVNTKPWLQGLVAGAALCAFVGFTWGGWVTESTARKNAAMVSHDAVVAAMAPVCADRFRAQPDAQSQLAALAKASTWDRRSIVEKSGFAVMPGSTSADSDLARACGELLATQPVASKS